MAMVPEDCCCNCSGGGGGSEGEGMMVAASTGRLGSGILTESTNLSFDIVDDTEPSILVANASDTNVFTIEPVANDLSHVMLIGHVEYFVSTGVTGNPGIYEARLTVTGDLGAGSLKSEVFFQSTGMNDNVLVSMTVNAIDMDPVANRSYQLSLLNSGSDVSDPTMDIIQSSMYANLFYSPI